MSPTLDNESSKSHRDSFEIDLDSCAEGKVDHYSEEGKVSLGDLCPVLMKNCENSVIISEHHARDGIVRFQVAPCSLV
jgi:hypothetical protein